jgi:hypothetical protein
MVEQQFAKNGGSSMSDENVELACEIELAPGEELTLPKELVRKVGPGRWLVSVRPASGSMPVRRHDAFLSSYAPEDEGLYDDLAR